MNRSRPTDLDRVVYAAEHRVEAEIGPDLSRWRDLVRWTAAVLADESVREQVEGLPLDVHIGRRSRGATASLAAPQIATILVRDGSRSALTVLHEVTHLVVGVDHGHDERFRSVLCELVRVSCGIEAATALRSSYRSDGLSC